MNQIKVAIVDDTPSFREGLSALVGLTPGFSVVATCKSAKEALDELPGVNPDVILMDINMPGMSGIACLRELRKQLPVTHAIMLTVVHEARLVFQAFEAGAQGYLLKESEPARIIQAIREVQEGGSPISSQIARLLVQRLNQGGPQGTPTPSDLTAREEEILHRLAKGFRAKEIADELKISVHTVQTHVRNIYEKLNVRSGAEAVARFFGGPA